MGDSTRRLRGLLTLLLAAASCTAQQVPTLQVQSRIVVLDVVVNGKHGELRNDLTQKDFTITEAGVPQTILHFERPAEHVTPPGPPIQSTAELERRAPQAPVTVVVLDEVNTRFQDMAYARDALKQYLDAQPGRLQSPALLLAVSAQHLQVLHDYTQDREAVLTALHKHLAAYPWHLETGVDRVRQLALSLGALEQVAQATAGHPGHKNVLWVGHGFPGINLSGSSLDQSSITGITTAIQQGLNMLRDSRITLYTVDPTALSSSLVVRTDANSMFGEMGDANAPDPFAGDVQFTALAAATGGKSFYSRNDVDREIAESAHDGLNFYTLTYRPTGGSDAEQPYRRIRVKITEPGLHAGFRDGYYTQNVHPASGAGKRVAYDIDSATENTMVYTGLTLAAIARPDAPSTYVIGVPQQELTWGKDGDEEVARLKLVAAVFDAKGKIVSRTVEDLTEHRPVAGSGDRTQRTRLEIVVPNVPNASRIRFVVMTEVNGRIGTADVKLGDAAH